MLLYIREERGEKQSSEKRKRKQSPLQLRMKDEECQERLQQRRLKLFPSALGEARR